jgi:thioredoxin-dependent peroxiredoxin
MKTSLFALSLALLLATSSNAADPQPPAAGVNAPDFSLPSQEGTPVSLEQLRGHWVVLYFYPKDFTSGCTLEAHNFQRDIQEYQKRNSVVVGISLDTVGSHKGFCAKEGLSFKLLADPDHQAISAYGSLTDYQGTAYAARNTFLIDPAGVIRKVYLKVKPAAHSQEVLADLDALQAQSK